MAAHPDDLEYGLAAAVDRWVQQGKTVTYVLATHGEAGIDRVQPSEAAWVRAQEERDGAAEVGVEIVGVPRQRRRHGRVRTATAPRHRPRHPHPQA